MKKLSQAITLAAFATMAIIFAATSPHSRANAHPPNEWEKTITVNADSFAAIQNIKFSNSIKK